MTPAPITAAVAIPVRRFRSSSSWRSYSSSRRSALPSSARSITSPPTRAASHRGLSGSVSIATPVATSRIPSVRIRTTVRPSSSTPIIRASRRGASSWVAPSPMLNQPSARARPVPSPSRAGSWGSVRRHESVGIPERVTSGAPVPNSVAIVIFDLH